MLTHWKHFTLEQRAEIAHGLAQGEPLKSIAQRIGMDPTSCRRRSGRTGANAARQFVLGLGEAVPRPVHGNAHGRVPTGLSELVRLHFPREETGREIPEKRTVTKASPARGWRVRGQ